jgi:aspartate aminotransferase
MLSRKVSENLKNASIIRSMFEEGVALKKLYGEDKVFDFSIGNPDPKPPAETQAALEELVSENHKGIHGYMSNAGYTDVRERIAAQLNKENGTDLTYENIIMTCGAGGGINVILKAILNPGEEVIVFSPYFVEYGFYIDNHGGHMVNTPTNTDTFQPDLEALEKSITANTKAIIINTPHNPTGVVYSENVLKEISLLIEAKQREYGTIIFVISDEPYREIVYDDTIFPSLIDIFNNAIIAYSFSKSLSLPGERIGYVAASNRIKNVSMLLDAMIFANRALGFVNAPSLFQRVVAKSIGSVVDVNIYKERRDLLYNHLVNLGFSCVKPQGAFYLFPKCPVPDTDQFKQMALKHNIILAPGGGFGCPDHFRLAYCVSLDTIRNSLPAFDALAKDAGL